MNPSPPAPGQPAPPFDSASPGTAAPRAAAPPASAPRVSAARTAVPGSAEAEGMHAAGASGRWIPTPVRRRFVARRPPVLPWLMGAAVLLAVMVLFGVSVLLVPMLLAMVGAGFAAWRWWSAMAVAGRMNDEVLTSPGRHARPDESVDLSALVPGQRSESPVLPPTAGAEPTGGEGRHRSPQR